MSESPREGNDATATEGGGAVAFDTIERAIADIAAGKAVVVVDDEDRENEGDLIFAAEKATPELVAFMVRYTSGYLCVPLDGDTCDRLGLPPMYSVNQDKHGTAYTVTVDYRHHTTTGISAHDRALTSRMLADPALGAQRDDFTRPGHMNPLRYTPGGIQVRRGHTETAVDLCIAAGLPPAGLLCELVDPHDPHGGIASRDACIAFAREHGIRVTTIEALRAWQQESKRV